MHGFSVSRDHMLFQDGYVAAAHQYSLPVTESDWLYLAACSAGVLCWCGTCAGFGWLRVSCAKVRTASGFRASTSL